MTARPISAGPLPVRIDEWVPPTLPDISGIDMWSRFDPPWLEGVVSRPVDGARTAALHDLDCLVRTGISRTRGGSNWGAPFQVIDPARSTTVKVWEATRPPYQIGTKRFLFWTFPVMEQWPYTEVRLPDRDRGGEYVRRLGDPRPEHTDCQAFILDPDLGRYYELSAVGPSVWPTPTTRPWRADTVAVWDLTKDWAGQRTGIVAGRLPFLPMLPTFEQYERGRIGHALHFAAAGYSPEHIWPARASDGVIAGHPLRAGARLRLTAAARDRLLADPGRTPHDRVLVDCMATEGLIVDDFTDPTAGDLVRQPQDPRIVLSITSIRRTDLEVLA